MNDVLDSLGKFCSSVDVVEGAITLVQDNRNKMKGKDPWPL